MLDVGPENGFGHYFHFLRDDDDRFGLAPLRERKRAPYESLLSPHTILLVAYLLHLPVTTYSVKVRQITGAARVQMLQ